MYSKGQVIDYIWQYSRYYGNLLISCDSIAEDNELNSHSSLIFLFNLTEIILKSKSRNFNLSFEKTIDKLEKLSIINKQEANFLNNKSYGIRKLRNILSHSNLSKYYIKFSKEEKGIIYPFAEIETCSILYKKLSIILFNIFLQVLKEEFTIEINVNTSNLISETYIEIIKISPEDMLVSKGFKIEELKGWKEMSENDRYRLAENSSNVNHLRHIFKSLNIS